MNILSAKHIENYILEIKFQDGTVKRVDFKKGLMHAKNPMNTKYRNINLFKKVKVEGGDLFWGKDDEMAIQGESVYKKGSNILLI